MPTAHVTSATETDGLLLLLQAAVDGDRKDKVHESLRHTLLATLFAAGQSPVDTELADVVSSGPAGSILYEVLGEECHTYPRMREGVMRAAEVRHAAGIQADHTFLVLPRPPAEEWAADVVSQAFGVWVIWRHGQQWEGQRVPLAVGEGE